MLGEFKPKCHEPDTCEELPCAYKLITHRLPAFPDRGNATLNYDWYQDDDQSQPGYNPVLQSGYILVPYTDDRCISVTARALDNQILTSGAGSTNYFHSAHNPGGGVSTRTWSFEFAEHKCAKLSKVFIYGTDVDVGEQFDISAFVGTNWVEAPENTVPAGGGGIYAATAANQRFVLEWDVEANGLPPVETITSSSTTGQGVFIYLADYYVPLKVVRQCDDSFFYYDENGIHVGQIYSDSDYDQLDCDCQKECQSDPRFPTAPPTTNFLPRATGPFVQQTSATSWWGPWSPIVTANQATQTVVDWRTVGSIVTAPDVPTDVTTTIFSGNHQYRLRRGRMSVWYDYRLRINGGIVWTQTNSIYHYMDEREDTNPDVITPIKLIMNPIGTKVQGRLNIPANATMEVQARVRWRVASMQSSGYARLITGLRSRVLFHNEMRQEVI